MNRQRMLERFLQYVKIDTTAVDESGKYPSSDGQLELGRLLVQQLKDIGIADAAQDEFGIVVGTVPGNVPDAPVVAFNSHVDTSPETTGKDVKPHVVENYDGSDITLSGDPTKILSATDCPELNDVIGKTIITTDGTTLLGGDDKAGVAIIMELANHLLENADIPRGPVRIVFTCDEEIGHGVDHVDLQKVAARVCYNFDGGGQDMVDSETFSADMAIVTVHGVNTHPAYGKDKMVNAMRAAGHFLARMPTDLSPERTEDREGFLHPYVIEGGVAKVMIKVLLRDFETPRLASYADLLHRLAKEVEADCDGIRIEIENVKQYRNMRDGLRLEPRAATIALKAHENLGRKPKATIIRGGTDGSRLTEMGLPTPNLSSGQHNIHSALEWACLDEMVAACEVGVEIVRLWSAEK